MQTHNVHYGRSGMAWAGVIDDRCTDIVVIPGILNGKDILMKFCVPM